MLSRRQFLASLAASVTLRPALGSGASTAQQCGTPPDQPWSYSQAHTLAVGTNTCVPELPPPRLPWTPPTLPAFDAAVGATLRQRFPAVRQHFVFGVLQQLRHQPVGATGTSGNAYRPSTSRPAPFPGSFTIRLTPS